MSHRHQDLSPGPDAQDAPPHRVVAAPGDDFDLRMRDHHRHAASRLSAHTRAQLERRLRASLASQSRPLPARVPAWGFAVACALVLAWAVGARWRTPGDQAADRRPAGVAGVERARTGVEADPGATVLASIDEPPDLYLWLASDDARAMLAE